MVATLAYVGRTRTLPPSLGRPPFRVRAGLACPAGSHKANARASLAGGGEVGWRVIATSRSARGVDRGDCLGAFVPTTGAGGRAGGRATGCSHGRSCRTVGKAHDPCKGKRIPEGSVFVALIRKRIRNCLFGWSLGDGVMSARRLQGRRSLMEVPWRNNLAHRPRAAWPWQAFGRKPKRAPFIWYLHHPQAPGRMAEGRAGASGGHFLRYEGAGSRKTY